MAMKNGLVVILAMVMMLLSACVVPVNAITVKGSGNLATEKRDVKGFDIIQLGITGKLEIIQGEEEGLEVSAEDNLLSRITTVVRGKTLEIGTPSNVTIEPTKEIIFTLQVKNLSAIYTSSLGSIHASQLSADKIEIGVSSLGNIEISDLKATDLLVRISSIGNITLAGTVATQDVQISSRGNYTASDLQSQSANVSISSSGNAKIWVVKDLSVQISSSGNVDYYGSPQVATKISSSGKVNALGNH
jgi:hypothetical protein